MKKTDKKIDNALRVALTDACESLKQSHQGFEWLTHLVNYADFPRSLTIICVFDTNQHLNDADKASLLKVLKSELAAINVQVKDIAKQVRFDSEENCRLQHGGKWNKRLG